MLANPTQPSQPFSSAQPGPSFSPQLIDPNQQYSIGQAAQILGVSIDTIRRWEQKGTLKAQRTAGKLRRFLGKELVDYQKEAQNQDLLVPISKAAQELHVSIQTLRRWDKSGKLKAERSPDGGRMYRLKEIREISHGLKPFPSSDSDQPQAQPDTTTNSQDAKESANAIPDSNGQQPISEPAEAPPEPPMEPVSTAPEPVEPEPESMAEEKHNETPNTPNLPNSPDYPNQQVTSPQAVTNDNNSYPQPESVPPRAVTPPVETVTPVVPEEPKEPEVPQQLQVAVNRNAVSKTPPEFDALGNLTKPGIEDHGTDSAGTGMLQKGTTKVVIKTQAVTKNAIILVTPTTVIPQPLCVPMVLEREGFAVVTAAMPQYDVPFHWIIVQTEENS